MRFRVLRMAPAVAALVYPALVWCVSAVTPGALLLTLVPLVACVYTISKLTTTNEYRGAFLVAHFAVGSPALYSFLGGWLDFQKEIPIHADGVWVILWGGLALFVALERPGSARDASEGASRNLAFAHGLSATLILLFAVFHLGNHLAGLAGGEVHMSVMKALRVVYRQPVIEMLLAAAIVFQVFSGVVLLVRRRRPNDWFGILQGASGAYILLFFASHLSAVLRARYLRHTDTNWVWLTSSNLLTDWWSTRLVPYYFLGIVALSLHGACAVRWILREHGKPEAGRWAFGFIVGAGGIVAMAVMVAVVGASLHEGR